MGKLLLAVALFLAALALGQALVADARTLHERLQRVVRVA